MRVVYHRLKGKKAKAARSASSAKPSAGRMVLVQALTENLAAGSVRRVRAGGREYLVAPLSLIVPGVLAGSQGAIFYPPEEVAKQPRKWDGMPLLAYHPFGPAGQAVSANHAGVVDRQGIGSVRNAHIDRAGRLKAEGWFDIERTAKIDKRILDALHSNQPIELSTGLFINRRDPAPPGANHQGKGYEWIGRDYQPDHVAILPDQLGACSIADGCGVLVNKHTCSCSHKQRGHFNMNAVQTFLAYNAKWDQDARDRLAKEAPEDFAGPHQSYPIKDQADVDHAARLVGHADDPEAVKRKIIAIAHRKGLSIPDAWANDSTQNAGTRPLHAVRAGSAEAGSRAAEYSDRLTANDDAYSDQIDQVRPLSRSAARLTAFTLPRQQEQTTDGDHRAASLAARALNRVNGGKLASAARLHQKAADLHDVLSSDDLFVGDSRGHQQHSMAADAHRRAAKAAKDCAGMVTTMNGMQVAPVGAAPSLNYAELASPRLLAVINGLSSPERFNADTYPTTAKQGPPSLAGSSGPHSFDDPTGDDDGDQDDPSIDRQQGGYWTGRTMTPQQFLAEALREDAMTEENRRRQGLDVPDNDYTEPDEFGSPSGSGVANCFTPAFNGEAPLTFVPVDGNDAAVRFLSASETVVNERRAQLVANLDAPIRAALFGIGDRVSMDRFAEGGAIMDQLVAERRRELHQLTANKQTRLY